MSFFVVHHFAYPHQRSNTKSIAGADVHRNATPVPQPKTMKNHGFCNELRSGFCEVIRFETLCDHKSG